jgi:hypothetical protein
MWYQYLVYQLLLETTLILEDQRGEEDPDVQDHYWTLVDCPMAASA